MTSRETDTEPGIAEQQNTQLAQQHINLQYDDLRANLDMIIQVNDFLIEHSDAAG